MFTCKMAVKQCMHVSLSLCMMELKIADSAQIVITHCYSLINVRKQTI